MIDELDSADVSASPPSKPVSRVAGVALMGFAVVAGVAVPRLVESFTGRRPQLSDLWAAAQAESSPSAPTLAENVNLPNARSQLTYLPFGEVTVNLDEGRMNRYLRLKMSLQIHEADQPQVEQLLKSNQLVLRNWLLSHLSDKTLDEIRGKAGQNGLRREIRTHFNEVLFVDRRPRISDILFEEFNVQ